MGKGERKEKGKKKGKEKKGKKRKKNEMRKTVRGGEKKNDIIPIVPRVGSR